MSCCPDYRHLTGAPRPIKYESPTPMSPFGMDEHMMDIHSLYPGHHDLFMRSPDSMDGFGDPFAFTDTPTSTYSSDPRGGTTVDPLDLTFPPSDFQSFAEWVHQPDELTMHSPASPGADSAPSLSSSRTSSLDLHGLPLLPDASATATTSSSSASHNCQKLAYATLESLTHVQGGDMTQTMDKVLNRNKLAVKNMHQLLQCACSKSPHLAMLYASITSKILMWYQLAAGCAPRPHHANNNNNAFSWDYFSSSSTPPAQLGSAASSPSMSSIGFAAGAAGPTSTPMATAAGAGAAVTSGPQQPHLVVTPMQFSVGAFSVDDESASEALRNQLLLSELKKTGNLIDLLTIQGRDELATGEVTDIYSALGTWLKCELSRTVATLRS